MNSNLPSTTEAARAAHAWLLAQSPATLDALNEPIRAALHACGYEHLDGTPWWDATVDELDSLL